MNKNILFFCLICMVIPTVQKLYGQAFYSPGAVLCDDTPYKLVYYDEFNGYRTPSGIYFPNALNPEKWRTIDDDNFSLGGTRNLRRSENVRVNSGVCTITIEKGKFPIPTKVPTLDADTPHYKTGDIISQSGGNNSFSYGKFEVRISYPSFIFAHSNYELTTVVVPCASHYDVSVAEAYGDPAGLYPPNLSWSNNKKITGTIGSFPPGYTSGSHPSHEFHFTPSGAVAALEGSFHTYTFEWEPNFVTWYIDGVMKQRFGVYVSYPYNIGIIGCGLTPGWYRKDPAIPLGPVSGCTGYPMQQMWQEFSSWVDKDVASSYAPAVMGEMKIDYVRIYQKHPDVFHHDLCDRSITGPGTICDALPHTYSMSGLGAITTSPIYNWSTSSNLSVISSSSTSITIKKTGGGTTANITFSDDNPTCPTKNLTVSLQPPPVTPPVSLFHFSGPLGGGTLSFYAFTTPSVPGTTYTWHIAGPTPYPMNYFGSLVTFFTLSSVTSWSLTAINACGIGINHGGAFKSIPTSCIALNLTDTSHLSEIEEKINNQLQLFNSNSIVDQDHICDIIKTVIGEYYPDVYLVNNGNVALSTMNNITTPVLNNKETILFPNPITDELNIALSNVYEQQADIEIQITDMAGKILIERKNVRSNEPIKIDLKDLPSACYLLKIQQEERRENLRFIKKD